MRGISRGGVQTCLMCPELKLMFDVGGMVPGQLRQARILVSHGHQDHLGGLPMMVSQRHLLGTTPIRVYLPQEVLAPMQRIFDAWEEIEGYRMELEMIPARPGDRFEIEPGLLAVAYRSVHRVPSLAWQIIRTTDRLKPEYQGRPGPELGALRRAGVSITDPHEEAVLCVSGDTKIELFDREPAIRSTKVLVFEVTGWDARRTVEDMRHWGHVHVDELIERAEQFTGEALVLVHRSPRHSKAEAEAIVRSRFPAAVRDRVHVFGN